MSKATSSQKESMEATSLQEPRTVRARRKTDFYTGQTPMEVTPMAKRRRAAAKRCGRCSDEDDHTGQDGNIFIGMMIRKKFGRNYFRGQVVSGPNQVMNKSGKLVDSWNVQYEDQDVEDLEVEELLPWVCTSIEPYIGMPIRKKFDDGEYYQGRVVSGPSDAEDTDTGDIILNWQVIYEDGEMEDLTKEELQLWASAHAKPCSKEPAPSSEPSNKKAPCKRPAHQMDREAIKEDLKRLAGITEEEIDAALDKMKPPYGINKAVQFINEAKPDYDPFDREDKFVPYKGLQIRKNFHGVPFYGVVTSDEPEKKTDPDTGLDVQMWEVREKIVVRAFAAFQNSHLSFNLGCVR
jgi:hypothetical protein